MKKLMMILIAVICCGTAFCADAPSGWTTDIKEAVTIAGKEKKKILILFTGSDWCSWCIRLKKDVLEKRAFKKVAKEKFVTVYFDFPHRKKLPARQRSIQEAWQKKLGISGYPTTVILDSKGRVIKKIPGFMPLDDYINAIQSDK